MEFAEIVKDKRAYMPLLLLADEQEDMVEKYVDIGRMFVLKDPCVKAECVVMDAGNGVLEIKNLAVSSDAQRQGYGRALIAFIEKEFSGNYKALQVGTGNSPLTVPFYEHCGFTKSHIIKNFFIENYNHPIFEAGKQLVDMVYFVKFI